jgi:hypothetical protein
VNIGGQLQNDLTLIIALGTFVFRPGSRSQAESQVSLAATSQHDFKLSSRFLNPGERIRSGDLPAVASISYGIKLSPTYLRLVWVGTDRNSRGNSRRWSSNGTEDRVWGLPPQMDGSRDLSLCLNLAYYLFLLSTYYSTPVRYGTVYVTALVHGSRHGDQAVPPVRHMPRTTYPTVPIQRRDPGGTRAY